MRLDESAKGVYAIAATPFRDDGELNLDSVPQMVEFYRGHRVDGLTVLGMMGEATKLTGAESSAMLKAVTDAAAGKLPVIVGVSNLGVRSLVGFSHEAMESGAAGVMIAPIPALRTDEQIRAYFATVMAGLGPDVPVVLQDFPPVTTVHMSAALIGELIDAFPQIVMVKHEDYPGLNKLSQLRKLADTGHRRVSILVGNGGLHLSQEMARGADGAMTGFAYPEMLVDVCRAYAVGEAELGEDIYDDYLPLVRHEAQPGVGLAIRKEILRRRGAIRSAHVRAPGPRLTPADSQEIDHLIARVERRIAQTGMQRRGRLDSLRA